MSIRRRRAQSLRRQAAAPDFALADKQTCSRTLAVVTISTRTLNFLVRVSFIAKSAPAARRSRLVVFSGFDAKQSRRTLFSILYSLFSTSALPNPLPGIYVTFSLSVRQFASLCFGEYEVQLQEITVLTGMGLRVNNRHIIFKNQLP